MSSHTGPVATLLSGADSPDSATLCDSRRTSHPSRPTPASTQSTTLVSDDLEHAQGAEKADRAQKQPAATPEPVAEVETGMPRDERDPNEVGWDGPHDPANPQNWGRGRKWRLTLLCALITVNVTFASSAPSSATVAIEREFGVSREVSLLVTALFLCGYVFGPFVWAPGSELLGRRPMFIVSLFIYIVFQLGETRADNIVTLLVCRFLSGFFASSPLTNAGGVIADIWDPVSRGTAMSLFVASTFLGPVLGPSIGGFLVESYLGWRWIFWLIMITGGAVFVPMLLFLPETYGPVLLAYKAKRLRKAGQTEAYAPHEKQDWSPKGVIHRTVYRPMHMLLVEPILLLMTIYTSVVYGLLYGLFEAFPIIWGELRGFSLGLSGLIFIGAGIGSTAGALTNICLSRRYNALTAQWHGSPPPEHRLYGAMLGGPLLVVGIFWLGWTGAYPAVPWYVPALPTILVGMSFTLVFISFLTYIVDTYLVYSASALAANTVIRSATAAAFPLFTIQMFHGMGVQWACTLLGCIGILLSPSPYIFFKYGTRIRSKSNYAPCIDLLIAEQVEKEKRLGEV